MSGPVRVLHVFATLGQGGPQVRAMQLLAHMGPGFAHEVIAMDGVTKALALLPGDIACTALPTPAKLPFVASARRFVRLLRERRPDLLLTYNWGSIEAVAAARWLGLRAFVHHEDGFGPEEQQQRLRRRSWMRRLLLGRAAAVIVPSQVLLGIAQREWRLGGRVQCLPNGVDLARFAPAPSGVGQPSEARPFTVGTVGGLRGEKDHATLLRAVAAMRTAARVLLVGDGPERSRLEALARELGLGARAVFAGATTDTPAKYRAMDAFALSSRTEQMPLSLLEAMASGLPVASTDVGDVRAMLPEGARDAIVPPGDPAALARALDGLANDPQRRRREGELNRARCTSQYELRACLDRFAAVYAQALR